MAKSYPASAPVFSTREVGGREILGRRRLAGPAMGLLVDFYAVTGLTVTGVEKVTLIHDGRDQDGWAPILVDDDVMAA